MDVLKKYLLSLRLSSLLKKVILCLIYVSFVLQEYSMRKNILEIIRGFMGFYLVYHVIYVFNDIWDFEEDKKKKIYFGKVLVREFVSREEYLAIGMLNLSLGLLLLSPDFTKIVGFVLLVGIGRTLIKNFYIRVSSLFLLEVLNIIAFYHIFFENSIDQFFKTYNILVTLAVSFFYTILYVAYRKSKDRKEFLKCVSVLFTIAIIFTLFIPKISIIKKILIIASMLVIVLALKSSKNYLKIVLYYITSIVFLISTFLFQ